MYIDPQPFAGSTGMGQIGRLLFLMTILSPLALRAAVITNLGLFTGESSTPGMRVSSAATDINDAGVVVGVSLYEDLTEVFAVPPTFGAFRWTGAGAIQPIPTLGGPQSYARRINASGMSVGWSRNGVDVGNHGVSHTPAGGTVAVANVGEAFGVNDAGAIVGRQPAPANANAFLYTPAGGVQDLGKLGGFGATAAAINNNGVVVGWSNYINNNPAKRAFRYVGAGPMQPIPGLPTTVDSEARAINDAGDIVGDVGSSAFRFTGAGALVALPGTAGQAWDINAGGYVVGSYGSVSRAALWTWSNTLVDLDQWLDLNDPIEGPKWTLRRALGINSHAQIVGWGDYNDGAAGLSDGMRGFVLDANALVPEPSSLAALLTLPVLAARRRRLRA